MKLTLMTDYLIYNSSRPTRDIDTLGRSHLGRLYHRTTTSIDRTTVRDHLCFVTLLVGPGATLRPTQSVGLSLLCVRVVQRLYPKPNLALNPAVASIFSIDEFGHAHMSSMYSRILGWTEDCRIILHDFLLSTLVSANHLQELLLLVN